ncbi:hypothetical protein cyc_00331 [Cyclospora cayetanensis]|uniref:Transmembrane protein n=1 Tax=Cyclospora cayetanensis TaxID=88456 RepID=A0A1D3CTF9_9EIME|nr:hypothetical protein cyc_00331 [Cyclospora cayetanensis]
MYDRVNSPFIIILDGQKMKSSLGNSKEADLGCPHITTYEDLSHVAKGLSRTGAHALESSVDSSALENGGAPWHIGPAELDDNPFTSTRPEHEAAHRFNENLMAVETSQFGRRAGTAEDILSPLLPVPVERERSHATDVGDVQQKPLWGTDTLGASSLSNFGGICLLLLSGILWLVQSFIMQHLEITRAECAEAAYFHPTSIGVASDLLQRQGVKSLRALLTLPYWQGLALAGALRLFLGTMNCKGRRRVPKDSIVPLSGHFELFAGFAVIVGQEVPSDLMAYFLGSTVLRSLSYGLLVAGSVLLAQSAYRRRKWEKEHLKEHSRHLFKVKPVVEPPTVTESYKSQ